MVRLGDGAEAKSLCVKPFDKRLVNVDHELLAGDILRAAGLRVPAARLVSQAEIDDEITPNLIAKFEHVGQLEHARFLDERRALLFTRRPGTEGWPPK